ncbi:MAG: PEPxxWA-CTERM sorting domain-containing protein, partial [Thermaurantiacus sp.]
GKMITLDSFDMARFTGTTLTELRVYDVDWTLLWSATDQLAPSGGRLSYAPGVSSTSGLILQHGSDTANRGLGNIRFTVSDLVDPPVVPEPATWAMLIMGFGLVGAAARRRLERTPA